MKINNRKRRLGMGWISLLVIVAMLTPMFSAIALAEDEEVFEAEAQESYAAAAEDSREETVFDLPEDDEPEQKEEPSREEKSEQKEESVPEEKSSRKEEPEWDDEDEDSDEDVPFIREDDDEVTESRDEKQSEKDEEQKGEEITGDAIDSLAASRVEKEDVSQDLTIYTFLGLDQSTYELAYKPSLSEVTSTLPKQVDALLSNGDEVSVPVTWTDSGEGNDFESDDYGEFIFVAELSSSAEYEVDEERVEDTDYPQATIFVQYVTALDAVSPDTFVLEQKPATVEAAVSELGLPEKLNATIQGMDEEFEKELPVKWTCEDYDERLDGDFTLTAELDKSVTYPADDGLEYPEVTLSVLLGNEFFSFTINEDQQSLKITEWKGTGDTLDVPDNINGIPVTDIADGAFADFGLRSVTLPDGLLTLGDGALAGNDLMWLTIPDTLEEIGSNILGSADTDDLAITLSVTGNTTLTDDGKKFKHDDKTIELPKAVSSIDVEGTLKLDTDFTIEDDDNYNYIDVHSGGRLVIGANKKLINKNSLTVSGSCDNYGYVYGCYSRANKTVPNIDDYRINHVDKDGICDICGEKVDRKSVQLTAELKEEVDLPITKPYDGNTKEETLTAEDFNLVFPDDVTDEEKAKVSIGSLLGVSYNSVDVDDAVTVTVQFSLDQDEADNNYYVEDLELEAEITAKNLEDADVTVDPIKNQLYTGEEIEPAVTVKWGGKTLKADEDYELSYGENIEPGNGIAVIEGQGNYTGRKVVEFKILSEKEFTVLKITPKDKSKLDREYDGTTDVKPALTIDDFNVEGIKEDDELAVSVDEATFDSADAGNDHTVTVKFKLPEQTDDTHTYVVEDLEITGVKITPRKLTDSDVSLDKSSYKHTGSAIKPAATVTFGSRTLMEGRDYTVSCKDNVNVGTATVTFTGKGNFDGTVTKTFKIEDASKTDRTVTIELIDGHDDALTKEYDGSTRAYFKPSDFIVSDGVEGDDIVRVSSVSASFDDPNAGDEKTVTVTFELTQSSSKYNYKAEDLELEDGVIDPRILTIYPTAGQSKTYGSRDPSYFKATERGLITGDKIRGSLSREEGEDVTEEGYAYDIGDVTAGDNYEVELAETEETFKIKPKPLLSADVIIALDKKEYRLDSSKVEPEVTVLFHNSVTNRMEELEEGEDFEVTYSNNDAVGTGIVTVKAVEDSNFTGSRNIPFTIKKAHSSSSGSSSHSGSSSSYDEDDDYDDEEEEEEETEEEEEEPEYRDPEIGELLIDLEDDSQLPVGYILFGEDNRPRPFEYETEDIEPDPAETATPDDEQPGVGTAENLGNVARLGNEEEAPLPKRLIINPEPLVDAEDNVIPLESDESRDKYELMHMRLTPSQIDTLKNNNFTEVVYKLENIAELRVPLDVLTNEIDLTPFKEEPEETAYADEENWDDESETAEDEEATDEADEDEALEPADDLPITPDLVTIHNYVFTIDQVDESNITERETAALEGYANLLPLYRVNLSAVDGDLETILDTPEGTPEGDAEEEPEVPAIEAEKPEPNFYSMLGIFEGVEFRVNDGLATPDNDIVYELPEDAHGLVISDDEKVLDEDAAETVEVEYINDELTHMDYALFTGTKSGLYTIVMEAPSEEEDEDDEDYGDDEVFEEDAEAESDEKFEEDEIGEIQPEEEPVEEVEAPAEIIEDPDTLYAYSRKANAGNQYWLINTQEKTVEYYRADTRKYVIGDYVGSLASGMLVTFRTEPATTTNIQLKFRQTYKFAMMDEDGVSLLMEQAEISEVESVMQGQRQ